MLQTVVNGLNKYLRKGNSLHICHCIYALLIYTSRPRFTSSNTLLICSHLFWSSTYAKALKMWNSQMNQKRKKKLLLDLQRDCTFLSDYNLEQKVCSIATVLQPHDPISQISECQRADMSVICDPPLGVTLFSLGLPPQDPQLLIFQHQSDWMSQHCVHLSLHNAHTRINTHVDISFFIYYIEMHVIKG